MSSPLVLLVLVVSSSSAEPTLVPFEQAAHEVLGVDTRLVVEAVAANLPDDEAVARAGPTDGVVEIVFDADGRTVVLHCYLPTEQRWVDRTIRFANEDRDADRGRLLGYAVASMYTSEATPDEGAPVPALAVRAPVVAASGGGTPRQRDAPSTNALEFAALGTVALAGSAETLGAAIAFEHSPLAGLWLRAGLSGRSGELEAASASTREALLAAGAKVMTPLGAGTEVGLRLDLLGGWLGVTHFSEDDEEPARRGRPLFGADLRALIQVEVSSSLELRATCGLEGLLGKTDITTHGNQVATIPALRVGASLGIGSRF